MKNAKLWLIVAIAAAASVFAVLMIVGRKAGPRDTTPVTSTVGDIRAVHADVSVSDREVRGERRLFRAFYGRELRGKLDRGATVIRAHGGAAGERKQKDELPHFFFCRRASTTKKSGTKIVAMKVAASTATLAPTAAIVAPSTTIVPRSIGGPATVRIRRRRWAFRARLINDLASVGR